MHKSHIDVNETSCTRDEAIAIIIGIGLMRITPLGDDATSEEVEMYESISFSLIEYLHDELETLRGEYAEAKFEKLSAELIAEKLSALDKHKKLIKDAEVVAPYFDDEVAKLAKGDPTPLRIDPQYTARPCFEHYTIISVRQCAKHIRNTISKSNKLQSSITPNEQDKHQVDHQANKKPWLIPDPLDQPTTVDWYPAARYFARQLIEAEPKLKNNKVALAKKVRALMAERNVYMRGGKKQPSSDTIRNAFVGMVFK